MSFHRSTTSRVRAALFRDQRGIALPMVLVIFLVGFALVSAFLVAIVGSAQVSNTTRSGIQAQAAAEAGIEAAKVALSASAQEGDNFCSVFPVIRSVDPHYSVTGTCNDNSAPTEIVLVSNGTDGGDAEARIQAVFAVDPPTSAGSTPVNAAGIYIGNVTGGLNGLTLTSQLEPAPAFVIANGNLTCNGGAVSFPGDVFVANGNGSFTSTCIVNGTLYVRGNVTDTNSGSRYGNIHATGDVQIMTSVGLNGVPGDLYVGGNLSSNNGSGISLRNAYVQGSATGIKMDVQGGMWAKGSISGNGASGAKFHQNSSDVPLPQVPPASEVPGWIDYAFDPAAWKAAGYKLETLTSTQCSNPTATLVDYGKRVPPFRHANETSGVGTATGTVVDATACASLGSITGSTQFELASNLALISKGVTFNWSATSIKGKGEGVKQFSVVTPDSNASIGSSGVAVAHCPVGGAQTVLNGVRVDATAKVNVYSSCGVQVNSGDMIGGIFTSALTTGGSAPKFQLTHLTLPGAAFGQAVTTQPGAPATGSSVPVLSGGLGAQPSSVRNVD